MLVLYLKFTKFIRKLLYDDQLKYINIYNYISNNQSPLFFPNEELYGSPFFKLTYSVRMNDVYDTIESYIPLQLLVFPMLNKMCTIMDLRYNKISQLNCRNIEEYNKQTSDKMCYYVIVIDELADLFIQAPDIELLICRLAQLGRAAGIHLITATQRPDRQTITGQLKVNMPARLALTVSSVYDSRIILDETGAEKLTGCGDFILKMSNGTKTRGQSALIKDINKLLEGVKNG